VYVKAPLLAKVTVPNEAFLAFDAINACLASPVPPCRPPWFAVNGVPGLLFAALLMLTKLVSPVVTIVYCFPFINEPSLIKPAVSLVNTLPDMALSKGDRKSVV
jgi:hypothetical protein